VSRAPAELSCADTRSAAPRVHANIVLAQSRDSGERRRALRAGVGPTAIVTHALVHGEVPSSLGECTGTDTVIEGPPARVHPLGHAQTLAGRAE
jgi:hypothetical protein